jgi:hypothetical protein
MRDLILESYQKSLATMFEVADSYTEIIKIYRYRIDELKEERDFWRDKCEFYETLIKGEVV